MVLVLTDGAPAFGMRASGKMVRSMVADNMPGPTVVTAGENSEMGFGTAKAFSLMRKVYVT